MSNVAEIKSLINASQGPAQPCHFVVSIVPKLSFLTGVSSLAQLDPIAQGLLSTLNLLSFKRLSLLAESASIPSRSLATTPHTMFGTKREMPHAAVFDTMNITFICTNIMLERTFFDLWHQFIIAPKSCYLNYYDDYTANIVISKTDNSNSLGSIIGEQLSTFILEEAYPKTIQAQELSYDSNDYLKLTVEFSYARFRTTLNYLSGNTVIFT